ncbi:MAG: hypothetical protein ACLQU4_14975 [Limisphaerales bacterium]
MKCSIKFLALMCLALAFNARGISDAIKEFVLDERTVYTIAVSLDRVTTISFPGPISAIDAAQVTADNKSPAAFQISHSAGTAFLSIRALVKKAATNLNIRWNGKTYVLELVQNSSPFYSVIFNLPPEPVDRIEPVSVSPHRLLALLDKAKGYPLLKAYHPESVLDVEYRNFAKEPRVMDYHDYEIQLDEVFRFDPEDTLVFHVRLRNKTDLPLTYAPDGFSLRAGERTYFSSISDANGLIPPKSEMAAYFAVTGTPNGGRNDLSLKNDFIVVLQAMPTQLPGSSASGAKAAEPKPDKP